MPNDDSSDSLAGLMASFRNGEKESVDRLIELLYPELRRLAAARMRRERPEHSWHPTLLVNELYLELVRRKAVGGDVGEEGKERAAFLGLAGFLMKRMLILHSRPLRVRANHVEEDAIDRESATGNSADSLHLVESLLSGLASVDSKLRTVVELRVFEGLTTDEIASCMDCSPRSVGTYWSFAKRWLETQLTGTRA
jgi:RNA polymerase sigma factor (TIGR02999 family)